MVKLLRNKLFQILAIAVVLRLFLLSSVPISLNWDEVSMGYTAYSVSHTGMDEWGAKLPLLFRSYGEWKSPVYIYLLVPLIKFFGMNAWTIRLPSAIAGIFAVYLTYLIARKLYGEKVALWASLLLAISPWHLVLSRPAFEANVSLTLILAGIYFFLRSSGVWSLKSIIYSALFFGLAPHTYNSAKVIVPFLVIYLVVQSGFYKNWKKLLLYGSILALFAFPILLGLISGRAQFRYSQVGVSTDTFGLNQFVNYRNNKHIPLIIGKLAFNKYTYTIYSSTENWLSYLNPSFLLIQAGDHNQHHVKYFGVLYLAEFLMFMSGLYLLFTTVKGTSRFLPLVLIALGIIPAALTRDSGHVLRSILTLPGWQLIAALGWVNAEEHKQKLYKFFKCILAIQASIFMVAYFLWYPTTFARDWQYGLKEAAAYVKIHESEYDSIVVNKWLGEPQLFIAFYNSWDPYWYIAANKENIEYEKQGKMWMDQLEEYHLGKYIFKYINFSERDKSGRTLYVGKFDDFGENPNTLKTIYYPDDTVAVHIMDGKDQ